MTSRSRTRFVALLDLPIGAGYLVVGLLPALLPMAWRPAVVAMAEVSLAAVVALPLLGAGLLHLSSQPHVARRRVVLLGFIACALLPLSQLYRHPDALPAQFLAPLLPALAALVPLWQAAGETWPGLALERRVARVLPLLAILIAGLFYTLLKAGWNGDGATLVLAGLTLPLLAITRNLLLRRGAPSLDSGR